MDMTVETSRKMQDTTFHHLPVSTPLPQATLVRALLLLCCHSQERAEVDDSQSKEKDRAHRMVTTVPTEHLHLTWLSLQSISL